MKNFDAPLFLDKWFDALKTRDSHRVSALYSDDAVLLPTLSKTIRSTPSEIRDYFDLFLAKSPVGEVCELYQRHCGEFGVFSGIYRFTFADGDSATARFTFVCRQEGDAVTIVEHHSSLLPE